LHRRAEIPALTARRCHPRITTASAAEIRGAKAEPGRTCLPACFAALRQAGFTAQKTQDAKIIAKAFSWREYKREALLFAKRRASLLKELFVVQLEYGKKGLGGYLHGTQLAHLLLACPAKDIFCGDPALDCDGRSEFALQNSRRAANLRRGAAARSRSRKARRIIRRPA
jgi:hypothetical protein